MPRTLSATFDNRRDAESAIAALLQAGFARGAIYLGVGDPTGGDSPITGNGGGIGAGGTLDRLEAQRGVGNFLHTLFGTDNSEFVQHIEGAVTHSHLVLTVTIGAAGEAERAIAVIGRLRPVEGEAQAGEAPMPAPAASPGPLSQLQAEPPGRAAGHEAAWRSHHARNVGDDTNYDEYAPAYLYGLDMATHEQHGGKEKEWEAAEPALRGEWERRHPQSAWSRFREAVQYGWERLRGGD